MKKLFDELMELCSSTEAFTYKDFTTDAGGIYRIFSYRLASYTDFLKPSALECRGSMFRINENGEFISIASRTPKKFFNAYENPFTMFSTETMTEEVEVIMDKLDGSIISTFVDVDFKVKTKSHTSLTSEHAVNTTKMIVEDKELYNELFYIESLGYTVNFEYTSPKYRIVLPYQEEKLTVLNCRHKVTGELILGDKLKELSPVLYNISVFNQKHNFPITVQCLHEAIGQIRQMKDIEGFVCIMKDGTMFKIKTDWYVSLHLSKDNVSVPSRLFEVVLNGASDDLRQQFETDDFVKKEIDKMEQIVFSTYNSLIDETETFYENNKHLDKKSFALAVKSDIKNELGKPGILFNLYNNKPVDYKEILLKYKKTILEELYVE